MNYYNKLYTTDLKLANTNTFVYFVLHCGGNFGHNFANIYNLRLYVVSNYSVTALDRFIDCKNCKNMYYNRKFSLNVRTAILDAILKNV